MKRIACMLTVLCLLAATPARADDTISFPDAGLSFKLPDGVRMSINTEDNSYFYPTQNKTPTVVFRAYRLAAYPDLMGIIEKSIQKDHPDTVILEPISDAVIGGFAVRMATYAYGVKSYTLQNACVTLAHGEFVYLFYTIEVPTIGATVGTLMEDIIASIIWQPSETATPGKT